MVILLLIVSFIIGTGIGSFFSKKKDEKYYFFRTFQLYQEGKVELLAVILASIVNTFIGWVIFAIIYFEVFNGTMDMLSL